MSQSYGDRQLVAPTWEPVTLAQAERQCRVRPGRDSDFLTELIQIARAWAEVKSERAIPQQRWELTMDMFPGIRPDDARPSGWRYGIIRPPRAPLISVESVEYIAPPETTLTYLTLATTEYQVDTNTEPGRIAPAPNKVWPSTNPLSFAAVRVRYTCGYASIDLVPPQLRQGIRLVVAHLYEHRGEAVDVTLQHVPLGIVSMITSASTWCYR